MARPRVCVQDSRAGACNVHARGGYLQGGVIMMLGPPRLRRARAEDAATAAPLLVQALDVLALELAGVECLEAAVPLFHELFRLPGNRYSHAHAWVLDGTAGVVGVLLAYPGRDEALLAEATLDWLRARAPGRAAGPPAGKRSRRVLPGCAGGGRQPAWPRPGGGDDRRPVRCRAAAGPCARRTAGGRCQAARARAVRTPRLRRRWPARGRRPRVCAHDARAARANGLADQRTIRSSNHFAFE